MTANKEKIIEVRGLKKTYGGEKKRGYKGLTPLLDVLKGIDIDIYRGDVVCLIGPSGCGKSTFLRCLNRLEKPTGGTIKFEGVEVDEAHIDKLRQKMGMVFQHFNLFPHMTVKENLEMAPVLLKLKSKEEAAQRADELLARVGLSDKADVYPASLSGGQQQRIAIARALAMDPDVNLFDEPTSALDPENGGRGAGPDERAGPHRHHHAGGDPRDGLCPGGVQPGHLHRRGGRPGGRASRGAVLQPQESPAESLPLQNVITRSRGDPFLPAAQVRKPSPLVSPFRQNLAQSRALALTGSHTPCAKFPCMCPTRPHMSAGWDFF